jgi:hypothetical protein
MSPFPDLVRQSMERLGMLGLCMDARVKPAHDEYDKF